MAASPAAAAPRAPSACRPTAPSPRCLTRPLILPPARQQCGSLKPCSTMISFSLIPESAQADGTICMCAMDPHLQYLHCIRPRHRRCRWQFWPPRLSRLCTVARWLLDCKANNMVSSRAALLTCRECGIRCGRDAGIAKRAQPSTKRTSCIFHPQPCADPPHGRRGCSGRLAEAILLLLRRRRCRLRAMNSFMLLFWKIVMFTTLRFQISFWHSE